MDIQWAKIQSWHAIRPHDHFGPTSYCGRDLEGREVKDKLTSEKSCEICLRTLARINDDPSEAVE